MPTILADALLSAGCLSKRKLKRFLGEQRSKPELEPEFIRVSNMLCRLRYAASVEDFRSQALELLLEDPYSIGEVIDFAERLKVMRHARHFKWRLRTVRFGLKSLRTHQARMDYIKDMLSYSY